MKFFWQHGMNFLFFAGKLWCNLKKCRTVNGCLEGWLGMHDYADFTFFVWKNSEN